MKDLIHRIKARIADPVVTTDERNAARLKTFPTLAPELIDNRFLQSNCLARRA